MTQLVQEKLVGAQPEPAEMMRMYRLMLRIRHFDGAIKDLFTNDFITGPTHTYIGEEAVGVGAISALNPDDIVTSTHRGHGHLIAKGGDPRRMMAELLGKATGYCKGKGGSMHIVDVDLGILGANGIVAAGLPIAVGAGWALQLEGRGRVVASFFGDGATNVGSFHEALNMAAIWNLPAVFICENNLYAVGTRIDKACLLTDLAVRATAYGIEGVVVDGNDILEVRRVVAEKAAKARAGGGPTFIECKTYRWYGHTAADPGLYRDPEEIAAWKAKDPIVRFARHLIETRAASREEMDSLDRAAAKEIEEAIEFAKASPEPGMEELLTDIYG